MLTNCRPVLLLCLLACAACFTSCASAKPEDKLVGKWRQIGGQRITEEFKPDGTFISTSIDAPEPVTGKYEFMDQNNLKITEVIAGGRTESGLFRVEFSEDGKRMSVQSDSGFSATFEKLE